MHLSTMDYAQHAFVAAAYGWLGDKTAATAHVDRILVLDPQFALETFLATLHYAQASELNMFERGC